MDKPKASVWVSTCINVCLVLFNFIAYTSLANLAVHSVRARVISFSLRRDGRSMENSGFGNLGNFAVAMLKASLGADDTWQQRAEVPNGLHTFA